MTKTVVFTGKDPKGETRAVLATKARQAGFWVNDNVTYSTDYLVASETSTSKAIAAKNKGVVVITYDEFRAMLAAGGDANDVAPPPPPAKPKAIEEEIAKMPEWGAWS